MNNDDVRLQFARTHPWNRIYPNPEPGPVSRYRLIVRHDSVGDAQAESADMQKLLDLYGQFQRMQYTFISLELI